MKICKIRSQLLLKKRTLAEKIVKNDKWYYKNF